MATRSAKTLTADVERLSAELTEASKARDAARDRLRDAVVKLLRTREVTEVEAAKLAHVSRQTVRTWAGKESWDKWR